MTADLVNHPPHYVTESGIEAINVMESYGLGLHLGNAMKYLLRAGRKGDKVEDLRKADWYLARWQFQLGTVADEPDSIIAFALGRKWRTPNQIVEAFSLSGHHRDAVLSVLSSAIHAESAETYVSTARELIAYAIATEADDE